MAFGDLTEALTLTAVSLDARAYSRNKRGIAGSLIWINFDRHALLNLIQQCAGTFVADIDEIRPQYSQVNNGGNVFQSSVVRSSGIPIGSTINSLNTTVTSAGQNSQAASPWYADQALPFDITLSGANEYGAMCAAKIFGVEILNEGLGISIDDAVTEMQATFVARVVEPMSAIASPFKYSQQGIVDLVNLQHWSLASMLWAGKFIFNDKRFMMRHSFLLHRFVSTDSFRLIASSSRPN